MITAASLLFPAFMLTLVGPVVPTQDENDTDVKKSVVKVLVTQRFPNYDQPWTKHEARESSGSGFVISGNRILTNAHVVVFSSQILVEPYGSSEKIPAKIAAIALTVDLAVLTVDDEAFFKSRPPLAIEPSLPRVQETVSVYGHPIGGTGLSVTRGIVSRIEFGNTAGIPAPFKLRLDTYTEPTAYIQIDAALNGGNSGGPALANGRVIGVARGVLSGAQRIGYLLSTHDILQFLESEDAAPGSFRGKPQISDDWQSLENRALRQKLGLSNDIKGVVIRRPRSTDQNYPLKEWDVITHIGEHAVDNTGMAMVNNELRVRFDYFAATTARDGAIPLTVVRGGEPMTIALPVRLKQDQVLSSANATYPMYFVYGPLVISAATADYVDASGPAWANVWGHLGSPLITRRHADVEFPNEQLVVVASQLPHPIAAGYASRYTQVITHVNDLRVQNLRHLVEVLRDNEERFVVFRFAEKQSDTLVFEHKEALGATEQILEDNGIRSQGSDELMQIWKARSTQ